MLDLLEMILRPQTLSLLIPITAITGGIYYNIQKMKLKYKKLPAEQVEQLERMQLENEELRERIESLEGLTQHLLQEPAKQEKTL